MFIILISFLMPALFFFIMTTSSLLNNKILRVGGVSIGFSGMMLSVINLIIQVICLSY
jgi:hypothetical protein